MALGTAQVATAHRSTQAKPCREPVPTKASLCPQGPLSCTAHVTSSSAAISAVMCLLSPGRAESMSSWAAHLPAFSLRGSAVLKGEREP
jgi:hypothetical protein